MKNPLVTTSSPSIGSLIEDLCSENNIQQHIIIACCLRSYFIEQLLTYVKPTSSDEIVPLEDDEHITATANIRIQPTKPRLILPILRTLATSSHTNLIFCPNILSFRAYMSTLPARLGAQNSPSPDITVLDMLAMHHGTSEFTVQGLSRTFALLASINNYLPNSIRLVESIDLNNLSNDDRGARIWRAEVPLLSGSVKIGEAGQGWATRTISIRRFAARWFDFEEEPKR